jgi:hypothetical protein
MLHPIRLHLQCAAKSVPFLTILVVSTSAGRGQFLETVGAPHPKVAHLYLEALRFHPTQTVAVFMATALLVE